MHAIIGLAVGLLLGWLLWGHSGGPPALRRRREERRQWVQTRNFLRYDGTEMPSVKWNKEERHE